MMKNSVFFSIISRYIIVEQSIKMRALNLCNDKRNIAVEARLNEKC